MFLLPGSPAEQSQISGSLADRLSSAKPTPLTTPYASQTRSAS
jgi:hypothetical protein